MIKEPLGYLGGDIMTYGSNLARQEEYDKFKAAGIPGKVYSPVQNKSINDKSNMTEEENNHLAEKICEADIERLWNSDYTVLCPEQSAIGTMCEMGVLYGWKYMMNKLLDKQDEIAKQVFKKEGTWTDQEMIEFKCKAFDTMQDILLNHQAKQNYAHYFDIRTNHLNEKDWRRSFSINQMLYGMILYATKDHILHNSFDEILPLLQKEYGETDTDESVSEWR